MLRKLGRIPDERSCFSPFASLYTDQASCPLSDAARTRTPKRVFPVTLPIGNLHRRGSDPALQSGPLHSSATQPKFHRESSIPPRNVSLRDAKSWYREGPAALGFASWLNPRSIELPTLQSRGLYASYPPGYIAPIYLMARVMGREPSVNMLMAYNLINHFLIALLLALTSFVFVLRLGMSVPAAAALSVVPALVDLFTPGTLYWHQNTFFADQAIILPFVCVVFMEVLKDSNTTSGKWSFVAATIQCFMIFYGLLTDWLFVFVVTVLYIKRLVLGQAGIDLRSFVIEGIKFWAVPVSAIILFAVQIHSLDGWSKLLNAGLHRARSLQTTVPLDGDAGQKVTFYQAFWLGHIRGNFGSKALHLIFGSFFAWLLFLLVVAVQRLRGKHHANETILGIALMTLVIAPPFAQVYFLKQHSIVHGFSALKFSLPLALVPFVVLPLTVVTWVRRYLHGSPFLNLVDGRTPSDRSLREWIVVTVLIGLASLYVSTQHHRWLGLFPKPTTDFDIVGPFIDKNTGFNDVVFSPHFCVNEAPPQWLSYTMKRVYKIANVKEICAMTKKIKGHFIVDVFVDTRKTDPLGRDWNQLLGRAEDVRAQGPLRIYKIPDRRFAELGLCENPR